MSITLNPLMELPDKVNQQIFSHLNFSDIIICSRVSKIWKKMSRNDRIWRQQFSDIPIPADLSARKYLFEICIKSDDDLIHRIHAFANKVRPYRKGALICLFPFHPEHKTWIQLSYHNNQASINASFQEMCIYNKRALYESNKMYHNIYSLLNWRDNASSGMFLLKHIVSTDGRGVDVNCYNNLQIPFLKFKEECVQTSS